MNLCVIPTAQQAQGMNFSGKTAVVIDVLRATSVITTALANGASAVIPVATIEEAKLRYAACDPRQTLRGGERHALKIEGFDLGNSPLEYTKDRVGGKTVILTTTNGTCAINHVKCADGVVLACFRNVEMVAEQIMRLSHHSSRDVAIVCAGTEGRFSMDDGLCAGMLIGSLRQKTEVGMDDLGSLLSRFYAQNKENLRDALSDCFHLKRLVSLGFEDDVRFCLETNGVVIVPVFDGDKFVVR